MISAAPNTAAVAKLAITTIVESFTVLCLLGQLTFRISDLTSSKYCLIFISPFLR